MTEWDLAYMRREVKPQPAAPAPVVCDREIVITKNKAGVIVSVTVQNDEGRIISVLAESAAPAVPLTDGQVAAGIKAWFTTEIAGKNQPFEGRMRAAYAAINGIGGGNG